MRKSTIMNRIRMAKQAGDEKEKAYWEGRLHEYKNDRKARRGGYQIYTVKEGDSYFSIAEDEYEDQLYAAEIAKANDGIFKLFKGMKIKLPPKKEEEKGPAFTYEDWGNVLLTNEDLAREGSSVNHMGRLRDYSEGELKKYFPNLEDYRNALDIRKKSMTANTASPGTQGQMFAGQRGVNGTLDDEISMTRGNRPAGNAGNDGVGAPQITGAGTVGELRYPEIDMSDTDLESSSPEAVEAWINEHPDQAWRKAYQLAAYRIATGQEQVPQTSETPRYGDHAQLAYAGEMGGLGNAHAVEGEGGDEPTPEPEDEVPVTPEGGGENPEGNKDWDSILESTLQDGEELLDDLLEQYLNDILDEEIITEPRVTPPDSKDMTDWLVEQIRTNANSPYTKEMIRLNHIGQVRDALKLWVSLVNSDVIWDLKTDIIYFVKEIKGKNIERYPIILADREENYQAIANIHYGVLGKIIGLPKPILEFGAGYLQKGKYQSGTSAVGPLWTEGYKGKGIELTFFDQPYDNYWVEFGWWLGGKEKPEDLTDKVFKERMNEYIDKFGPPPPLEE